jgi:hypothetical protein
VQYIPESVDRIHFCLVLVECNRTLHEFHIELTQFLIDMCIQNNGTWNKITELMQVHNLHIKYFSVW